MDADVAVSMTREIKVFDDTGNELSKIKDDQATGSYKDVRVAGRTHAKDSALSSASWFWPGCPLLDQQQRAGHEWAILSAAMY